MALLLSAACPRAWATVADPLDAVVRIAHAEQGGCSGVLVGADLVLTAGHCVAGPRGSWNPLPPASLSVRIGERDVAVLEVTLAPRAPWDPAGRLTDLGHDWALLRLSVPGGTGARPLAYLGGMALPEAFTNGERIVKVAREVGPDGGAILAKDNDCRLVGMKPDRRTVAFDCGEGAGRGRSGSALLLERPFGLAVLGVQSGINRGSGEEIGVGVVVPKARIPNAR